MEVEFQLGEYLSNGIENIIKDAMKAALKNPKEILFLIKYFISCKEARKIRFQHETNGEHIPSFLIGSTTNSCNLNCKGCYARANQNCLTHTDKTMLSNQDWAKLFKESSELGIRIILLAGGEPLMRRDIIDQALTFRKILFLIFTNGTLINKDYLQLFDRNRNLLPVLSIEGQEDFTDQRRGTGVYQKTLSVMEAMKEKRIFYGASITVTKDNLLHVTGDTFLSNLNFNGCKIIFFIEYVPVDRNTKDIAPTDKERRFLEEQLKILRIKFKDMLFLSFPGDEKNFGGCLAAGRGFFHINPYGQVEPCPFSPYSDYDLRENSILEAIKSPFFEKLKEYQLLNMDHTGGCSLFEQEEKVKQLYQASHKS